MFIDKKTLIFIAIVFVLSCGLYWNMSYYNNYQEKQTAKHEAMRKAIGEWKEPPPAKNFLPK